MQRVVPACVVGFAFVLAGGCEGGDLEVDGPAYSEDDDLIKIGGKFDTGYYSNLAMELEGDFEATLELDVTDLSEEDRHYLLADLVLANVAREQVKMAKNQLNAKLLHLNLTAGDVTFLEKGIQKLAGVEVLIARYRVQAESLVTIEELDDAGMSVQDLIDTWHQVTVPADPRGLLARAGETCAADFAPGTLVEQNYFYYFQPESPHCTVAMSPDAVFHVRALIIPEETFPEYDRLTQDGVLEVAVFFGAYTDESPPESDWGVLMWRTYAADLRVSGYEEVDGAPDGQRYERNVGGLAQIIDLYSPHDLYALGTAAYTLFGSVLGQSEIIAYNGHSFYGSLDVLDSAANYPDRKYQILFMNSCWSYEYYTKQVFRNKATESDPTGWEDADVVNNTTYAYFPNMEASTRHLIVNLLAGAVSLGADDLGRRFSWQNIIGAMNDESMGICPEGTEPMDCRHYQPKSAHEIYGVSGVRTNTFEP